MGRSYEAAGPSRRGALARSVAWSIAGAPRPSRRLAAERKKRTPSRAASRALPSSSTRREARRVGSLVRVRVSHSPAADTVRRSGRHRLARLGCRTCRRCSSTTGRGTAPRPALQGLASLACGLVALPQPLPQLEQREHACV
eukprot:349801-Chlamydomonas_euryale.AAC.51